jgi:hypothetical protein
MKKNLAILLTAFLVVALSGLAYAANEKDATTAETAQTPEEQEAKQMTYGQCVSEHAQKRKTCYSDVKTALETCKTQAPQDAGNKDAVKQCSQTYKKDKKECKATFKASKKECDKIKHNFLETMGSAFK